MFLEESWELILQVGESSEKGLSRNARAGDLASWNSEHQVLSMIECAINILKPIIVVEIGTFEGMGTLLIAQSMNTYPPKSLFFTIDINEPIEIINEDPLNLGPVMNWESISKWSNWRGVVEQRNKNLAECAEYNNVTVRMLYGIGWDVLPKLFEVEDSKEWDFCYQDSCHQLVQIQKEWAILREHAHSGSVIVFDDIPNNDHGFLNWFKENELGEWDYRYYEQGCGQLWAEKR